MFRAMALALLCTALPAAPAARVQGGLEQLLGRLEEAQRDLRTLQAEFVQRNRVKLFRQEVVSRGRLFYQRGVPSQLRWEYLSPDPSTLILTGDRAHLLMPGRPAQVFDAAKDATLRAIFAELELWLGTGSLRGARGEYDLSLGGPATVVLAPKPTSPLSRTFSRIEMRLDPKTLHLAGLLLVEKGGDEKEIQFSRSVRNGKLPEAAFKL